MNDVPRSGGGDSFYKALFAVAAAGAFATGFILIGVWLVRRVQGGSFAALPASSPEALPFSFGLTPAAAKSFGSTADTVGTEFLFGNVTSFTVSSTPQRILTRARSRRRVTVTATQPIRVLDGSTVSALRGVIVPANQPTTWPVALGGEVELWAIRESSSDASVSVIAQPEP